MLRLVLLIGAPLAAAILLIAIVGLLLPQSHVATRAAVVGARPEAVFAILSEVEAYAAWRRSLSAVEIQPPVEGRARWVEISGGDRVAMEMIERRSPDRLVTRIADPDLPFGGTWTFELAPLGDGTRVTITERGEVYNPIFRVLSRVVFGHGTTMETCLRELEARLAGTRR